MPQRTPELEPIERASQDELRALQLERLQWSLRHAYAERRAVPRQVRARRRASGRLAHARRPGALPVHRQGRPARELPVRPVRGAARAAGAPACLDRHDRQADRGRLHPRATSTPGPTSWRARSAPPAVAPATWCTSPTAMACSPAAWARTTAPSGSAAPWCRCPAARPQKQVQLICDFTPGHHHGDALVHAGDRRGVPASGNRCAATSLAHRHLRRRAVDRGDARRDRAARGHRRDRHLRAVGSDGPRRGERVHRDQGRPGDLGGSLLSRDHRPDNRRGAARRRRRASWCSPRSPRRRCP